MTWVDDQLARLDRLAGWLSGALDALPQPVRADLVVTIVVAAILVVPLVVVHRVLPPLVRLLAPVTAVVTGLIAAAALTVDFLLARAFRLFWLPLTGAHYAAGDWAIDGTRWVRTETRYRAYRAGRWLRGFSPAVLLIAGIAVTVLWNAGYCDRNPGAGCVDPLALWWRDVWAMWQSLWD